MTKIKVIEILVYRNTYWLIVVEILLIDNSQAIAGSYFYLVVLKDILVCIYVFDGRVKDSGGVVL